MSLDNILGFFYLNGLFMFLDPVVNLLQNIVNKTTSIEESPQVQGWDDLIEAYNSETIIFGSIDHKVERGYMIRFGDIL